MHPWDIGKREHYLPITNLNMIKNHHRLFDEARTTIDNNNNSGGSSNSSNNNSWMWKVQRLFNAISAWPYPNVYTHTHTSHCDDVLYWVLSVNPIPFNPYLSAIFTCRVLCVLESREREGERLLLLQLAICLCLPLMLFASSFWVVADVAKTFASDNFDGVLAKWCDTGRAALRQWCVLDWRQSNRFMDQLVDRVCVYVSSKRGSEYAVKHAERNWTMKRLRWAEKKNEKKNIEPDRNGIFRSDTFTRTRIDVFRRAIGRFLIAPTCDSALLCMCFWYVFT